MDRINIIGTLFDNSVEHTVALALLIKDLRLEKNLLDINEDIYNKIDTYLNYLYEKISSLEQDINKKDNIKHVFLTLQLYDALDTYEKDTLYFIIEKQISGSGSRFGDTFPLIFGQASSNFGDPFPLILG